MVLSGFLLDSHIINCSNLVLKENFIGFAKKIIQCIIFHPSYLAFVHVHMHVSYTIESTLHSYKECHSDIIYAMQL